MVEACEQILRYLTTTDSRDSDNQTRPRVPFVYALTSESDEKTLEKIRLSGFKAIFHNLDQDMMRIIKEDAGYEFNEQWR